MARKKLSQLHQTHGQVESFKPTTIDQILGDKGNGSYKFLKDVFSESEYGSYLKGLADSELYTHCQDYGIIFIDNRKAVEKKLLGIFRESRAKYRMPANANLKVNNNPDYNVINKIMAAGK